jgi:tetratricopeptide (TPR) repeat protein
MNKFNKLNKGSVYLSYADKDLSKVWNIYEGLKRRGLNVWFDKMDFKHSDWRTWVNEAINLSSCFVVCVSYAALREISNRAPDDLDKNMRTDYGIAQNVPRGDIDFVPIIIEDYCYGNFYLSSLVRYELFKDFERELDNLAVALGGCSSSDPEAIDKRNKEERKIDSLMSRAEIALYAGDCAKSIITGKHVLTLRPDVYGAWNNIGTALFKIGHKSDAIDAYDMALKIKPDYYEAWSNKGNVLHKSGLHDAAINAIDQALNIMPDAYKALFNKGLVLSSKGKYRESIEAYDKAIKIKPDYREALKNKTNALYRLGHSKKAVISYKQAMK